MGSLCRVLKFRVVRVEGFRRASKNRPAGDPRRDHTARHAEVVSLTPPFSTLLPFLFSVCIGVPGVAGLCWDLRI